MASQFDASISRMKASFDAIAAAKTHTVVLDCAPDRKTTGKAGATTITKVEKVENVERVEKVENAEKPANKYVEYTKMPEGIQFEVTKKPALKKSSKLKKLLRGKTVDCSK